MLWGGSQWLRIRSSALRFPKGLLGALRISPWRIERLRALAGGKLRWRLGETGFKKAVTMLDCGPRMRRAMRTKVCGQWPWVWAIVLAWVAGAGVPALGQGRQTISLNGDWEFRRDTDPPDRWKTVTVPSSFEQHEGPQFDGVGWYRKRVGPLKLPAGGRLLLHFQAAATEAQVWWNQHLLGSHLGGWTPFRFDVTELVRQAPADAVHEVRVRLDEKVGHNTQGFLPAIAPHFGGLWQEVNLLVVPETYCDELRLLSVGDPVREELCLEIPLAGKVPEGIPPVRVGLRLRGSVDWQWLQLQVQRSNDTLICRAPVPGARPWWPSDPALYEVAIEVGGPDGDRVITCAAFRSIEVWGPQLRLNGQPIQVRGLLNWGYSAPLTAPNPGEAVWRRELELARAWGFNLMKFCLWVPPKRYLELADELGMLAWMEYPTWHPKLTAQFLEPLRREFTEFFWYDRNHPCIILRSLTCETGHGADLEVIRSLYELAKAMIPGALVEDDSSWIEWQRIADFYDDHPYGNNHTWVKTLQRLGDHILAHGLKPLVLGEAMAADTWLDRPALLDRLGDQRPWWAPGPIDQIPQWIERLRAIAADGLEHLGADSLRYAWLMRKYQIEAYRRQMPYGGYVVSVIRDIPNASMGLIDYLGRPKWTAADWAWHRDTICLLKTEADRRSFSLAERLRAEVWISHFGQEPLQQAELELTLQAADASNRTLQRRTRSGLQQNVGTVARWLELDWPLPEVTQPQRLVLCARLQTATGTFTNHWPLWVVPAPIHPEARPSLRIHSSVAPELAHELFPAAEPFQPGAADAVAVAARFDDALVDHLEQGGRVLLLPDGQKNSLPLQEHWFLRGAPYVPERPLAGQVPRQLLVELQAFDLAGPVVPDIDYLEAIDPVLLLWDTHDLKTVKTHALIFETRAGAGRLLVSAVRHAGPGNAVGRWLLDRLVEHLCQASPPRQQLPEAAWSYLKQKLHAEQTNLTACTWQFRPDPKDEGLALGWHRPGGASDEAWRDIRIGTAWEAQGYPNLDGWAWYRLWVDIPARWQGRPVFVSFEGVDDVYELYVNGQLAGRGGDLATRKDAFNEKKSHNITALVQPGQRALLAVRVHDWYGAGGIFRPVTLGTVGFSPGMDLLK